MHIICSKEALLLDPIHQFSQLLSLSWLLYDRHVECCTNTVAYNIVILLSSQSMYVEYIPVDYERANGEKCLELLSHDAHTVFKDALFAELSASLFLSHSLPFYIAISHSLSLSLKGRDLVPLSNAGFLFL